MPVVIIYNYAYQQHVLFVILSHDLQINLPHMYNSTIAYGFICPIEKHTYICIYMYIFPGINMKVNVSFEAFTHRCENIHVP